MQNCSTTPTWNACPSELTTDQRDRLARNHIVVREESLSGLQETDGRLEQLIFATGETLRRQALFLAIPQQRSPLPAKFGCVPTGAGDMPTGPHEETHVPGLDVTGDASTALRLAIGAAAKGAEAAFDINEELLAESLA